MSVVADVDDIVFDVEVALSQQLGICVVFLVILSLWTIYPRTFGIP